MKHRVVLFLWSISILIACKEGGYSRLDLAESLLNTKPDSALVILNTLQQEELGSRKSKARYALLMSAALDENYIDVQSDSLITIAVDYYSKKRCCRNRMLAWYYQGIVLNNAKDYIPSMLAFEKAESDARELNELFYLGLIFRNKATLNHLTNNTPAAIDNWKKAIECFEIAEVPLYLIYAKYSLATEYANNKDFIKADSLLQVVKQSAPRQSLLDQSIIRRASILVMQDTLPEIAVRMYQNSPERYFTFLDYAYLAQAFEMTGQKDSADYWITEGYAHCQNREQNATLDYMASRIQLSRGDYESAFHLLDNATTVQDSLTRILLQQSISSAQRDYYKNEAQFREERIRHLRERTTWGASLGVLTLLLIIAIATLRSRRKDRLIQDQMTRLALEERDLEQLKRERAHLVGTLFNEKIGHVEELNDLYFKEEDEKKKSLIFRQIKQTVASMKKDPALFLSLERDLDRYCNGVMSKLRQQVPAIKGINNIHTIMLFFAGFSYPVVQLILNKQSIESLKTARSRYRKEILSSGAADADLFINMLEMKKRPQAVSLPTPAGGSGPAAR